MGVSRALDDYRDFIQRSKAEFGVAKHTYVATRSGWFSDRTECYLASGRPALVQDTGWTAHLPSGEGVLAFSTPEEALAGIDRINADYARHAQWAREVAREHFAAERVLPKLLETACSCRPRPHASVSRPCASRMSGRSRRRFRRVSPDRSSR